MAQDFPPDRVLDVGKTIGIHIMKKMTIGKTMSSALISISVTISVTGYQLHNLCEIGDMM